MMAGLRGPMVWGCLGALTSVGPGTQVRYRVITLFGASVQRSLTRL